MASTSNSAGASTYTEDGDNCYQYDVFLNHRGPDVKKTFASDLYRRLKAHGLRVFLDQQELQKGEKLTCQIEGAIRAASVHIAIFSPNYAESKWCLDELLLMLESMREKGSKILPVFFRVKPSELRWTEAEKGVYAQALRSLQNKKKVDSLQPRYDSNTIGEWKKALYEVAEIIGFELEEGPYYSDEGKLLADVVEKVLRLVPKTPLYVAKYPTGLDDKLKDFEESVLLQNHENGEARVVGIVGLGGVGKTTLGKEFFNVARTNYSRSSFLSDVRENDSRGSLNSLQRILIKDLTQLDVEINNTHQGIPLIKRHLSPSHAFIIVDDVDHIDQLDALVSPAKDVLGSNSLIVVTSREKDVLTNWGIDDFFIYELRGLNPQHSTELFCWHAFHQSHAVAGFEQVVTEFVDACKGLPLSLKVIGALLYRKNLEYWKAQLRKISKTLPHDIQKTLKISYDRLDDEEKQIFLDTACFWIGKEKDTAIRLWDGSGWEGSLGLQNLQNKCLVEVQVEKVWMGGRYHNAEVIRMHDHLRDLGRYLADKEPLRRIWRLAENLSDQSPVRGIKNSAEGDRLVRDLSLQLPDFKGSCVETVFSVEQSPQLIMLRWYNCPYSLPPKFSTENLRVLHIERSNWEILWHLESQAPLQLRELFITTSRLPKNPESIGQLKHLEKVVLRGDGDDILMRLGTLPPEFCELPSLKHLELNCRVLKSLPYSFGNLTNLEHVNLGQTSLEMLPDSFGNLSKLQHLDLIGCSKLQMLPDSFGNLTKLQHIDLAECRQLQMLPNSFGNLIQLKLLHLNGCYGLTMSNETLGKITTLECFNLTCCNKVLPPQLTYQLFMRAMRLKFDFKELPSAIGNLSILKILSLKSSCLEMLPPSFGYLRSLEELQLFRCPLKCFPDSIRMLTQLKILRITLIENLEQLEIRECLSREVTFKKVGGEVETATDSRGRGVLSKLDASEASYSNAVFPNLQHLHIEGCDRLVEVGALPTTLQTLDIQYCTQLEELPSLETLVSLEKLEISACRKLKRIHGLGQLTKLQNLHFEDCSELEELPGVEHSRSLSIRAIDCPKLQREYESLH